MEDLFKLQKIRERVKKELVHIPRGDFNQNMLRQFYWALRMSSLGKKATVEKSKEEVLANSIKAIREENHNFIPKYDKKFFDENSVREY